MMDCGGEDAQLPMKENPDSTDAMHAVLAQKEEVGAATYSHEAMGNLDYGSKPMLFDTIVLTDLAHKESPEIAITVPDNSMPSEMDDQDDPNDKYDDGLYGPGGPSDDTGEETAFRPLPYGASDPERKTRSSKRGKGRIPSGKRKFVEDEDIGTIPHKPRKSSRKIPASELRKSVMVGTEVGGWKKEKSVCSKKVAKPQNRKKKRVNVGKKKFELNLANIGSLGRTNTLLEATANSGRVAQPGFTETRKAEALRELLASVPEENRKVSRIDMKAVESASKIYGQGRVKADGRGTWLMKGMRSSLHHYQLLGAAFMHMRETGDTKPYGGLSADEMGFGKTVMMIATMISNPPPPDYPCKTTLIVATRALVTQWMAEIKKHGEEDIFKIVIRYHAGSRIDSLRLLECADVILTTYNEVASSYPKNEPPKYLKSEEDRQAWWKQEYNENKGLLHSMMFYRIILDEAHAIKNHKTRVRETRSFAAFKEKFCQQDSATANEKLQTILNRFMIRRTHGDSLFGAPLIKLPRTSQSTVTVHFNQVERAVYDHFHIGYIKTINGYIQLGTLEQMYQNVLTMLLRLRQLTAHMFLVQEQIRNRLNTVDIDKIADSLTPGTRYENGQDEMLTQLKNLVSGATSNAYQGQSSTNSDDTELLRNDGDAGDLTQRFIELLQHLKAKKRWEVLKDRKLCQKCHGVPEDAFVLDCLHVYCKDCLESLCDLAAHSSRGQTSCLGCGLAYNAASSCEGIPELSGERESGRRGRPKRVINDKDSLDFVEGHNGILQSAKTSAVAAQVSEWMKDSPSDKIIVFSQFRMIMAIMARTCEREKWGYCEYNGRMSHAKRTKSLSEFESDDQKRVLIASLKCGGIGLNLTMASRVICIDLWWNESVEQQSFCRVFRLGQTKETHIKRIVVSNTVDQRLIEMQVRKKARISEILGDDNPEERLTTKELVSLFGHVEIGEDGNILLLTSD